ncbi:MAG: transaldolase family protein [Schumannella sp.]
MTLIFSLERHREVIHAYLEGVEQAKAAGIDLSGIRSVASFLRVRVDTEVDRRLCRARHPEADRSQEQGGRGQRPAGAPASEQEFATDRARPCWRPARICRGRRASTGVKDPSLPDTLYVTELAVHGVVNTMPEKTMEATFDHAPCTGMP